MERERFSDPAVVVLGALGAYNLIQNLAVGEGGYVPANLVVTAGLTAYARASGATWDELGLEAGRFPPGLRVGSIAALATAAGVGGLALSERGRVVLFDERARGHDRTEALFRAGVRFPCGTALFEEVMFRGVLYGLWNRRSGRRAAWAVTAAAFGLWHLLPTYRLSPGMGMRARTVRARLGAAAVGAVATSVSSLGFTWMRDRSRSVAAPWLAHTAFNTLSYLASREAWRRLG